MVADSKRDRDAQRSATTPKNARERKLDSFVRENARQGRQVVRQSTRLFWAVGLLAAGCERADAQARPAVARTAPVAPARPSPVAKPAAAPSAAAAWVDALRAGRYSEAAKGLDALGPELAKRPELAFARARAALELRDYPRAAELAKDLETKLPLLEDRVKRLRADATGAARATAGRAWASARSHPAASKPTAQKSRVLGLTTP